MKSNSATAILRECEKALQSLLSAAANAGNYTEVQKLAELARAVAALACENDPVIDSAKNVVANGKAEKISSRPAKLSKEEFPQFFRRGDELVKVGWSKKEKRKYHHRAPRKVIQAASAAVREIGSKGRSFTGDEIMPIKDSVTGEVLPSYQVYIALAWMKQLGLVKSIGQRGGYMLCEDKPMDAALTSAWPDLPEWAG